MSKTRIVIFGASGQAMETIDLIENNVNAKILGLIDIKPFEKSVLGYKYLGSDSEIDTIIENKRATHFFVAIGDLKIRSKLYEIMGKKLMPLSIFSKKANISKYAKFGDHVIIYPGVTINAGASVGNNVLLNSNASVGHEVKVGNHVNIQPGANIAGRVEIGDFSTIGIGASVRENLKIAKNTFIGGGAMVIEDTKSGKTYAGVPAKILKT